MTDNQEPTDFDNTPPLSRILCDQYLDGKIALEAVAEQLGMSMEDAQGCVDVVQKPKRLSLPLRVTASPSKQK